MTITNVAPPLPRDRYNRPMVIPPTGGKPVAYTRCTTFVSVLDDTFNLSRWQQRMVARGLAERPDLLLQISSLDLEDKEQMNKVCEKAMEHAKAHAASTIGTALHALCERMDRGQPLGVVPKEYEADLHAYADATSMMHHHHIEQFSVRDNLRIGGTPDRVVEIDGKWYIADIKTGSIDWSMGKIEMQLAVYANSVGYDHTAPKQDADPRFDLGPIDTDTAIVIHLPAGTGTCRLVPVDIKFGWHSVALANDVRQWRQHKRPPMMFPWEARYLAEENLSDLGATEVTIAELIANAQTETHVRQVWADNETQWTDADTELAKARIAALNNGSAT